MSQPLVSLCIPTFNRARYLSSLLSSLAVQFEAFPHPYEIVIADNASSDTTGEVVTQFANALPLRYLRHEQNIGGYANVQFVLSQGIGRYLVYLSDDDCLLGEQVAATVATMEADPDIAIAYAPWLMYDLVDQKEQGQFYSVPRDLYVQRGCHGELLDHILRHHIFPEVQIVRRDAFNATLPRVREPAFLAFMHAADYLTRGAVLIRQQPFYVSITRYFADEERTQLGTEEVEYAWDRYRGGLDYLLARSNENISVEERHGYQLRIQRMIAQRMAVAVRLRHLKGRDPVDTYYIAMRMRGMGYESLLPVPLATLASAAALAFLLTDTELNRGMKQLLCVGPKDANIAAYLRQHAKLPVEFTAGLPRASDLSNTLVFLREVAANGGAPDTAELTRRNARVIVENDLMAKFGL
jgi:glycosyltransferase involved in cell wall biosynthesis